MDTLHIEVVAQDYIKPLMEIVNKENNSADQLAGFEIDFDHSIYLFKRQIS